MTPKTRLALLTTIAIAATTGSASAVDASRGELEAFLDRAQRMGTLTLPVRADIIITRNDKSQDHGILIIDPREPGRQFIQIQSRGWRSLMPLGWSDGQVVKTGDGRPERMRADEPIAGTDLRPMEMFPFWAENFQTAFVSDDTRLDTTISLYAKDGAPYSLYVITFDKAKIVPLTTKYYRDDFKTMVRLRENSDYTMVGSRPMPQKIVIRDYAENTSTTFELKWKLLENVPEGLTGKDTFWRIRVD